MIDNITNEFFNEVEEFSIEQVERLAKYDLCVGFLKSYLPEEIESNLDRLLASQINISIKDAQTRIEKLSNTAKSQFYELNLRDTVREWANANNRPIGSWINPIPKSDIRKLAGTVMSSVVFVAGGSTIGILTPMTMLNLIIGSIATIVLSVIAYKTTYGTMNSCAINQLKKSLRVELRRIKNVVLQWLKDVEQHFEIQFNQFLISIN